MFYSNLLTTNLSNQPIWPRGQPTHVTSHVFDRFHAALLTRQVFKTLVHFVFSFSQLAATWSCRAHGIRTTKNNRRRSNRWSKWSWRGSSSRRCRRCRRCLRCRRCRRCRRCIRCRCGQRTQVSAQASPRLLKSQLTMLRNQIEKMARWRKKWVFS